MENLFIAATATSPEVDFRFDANVLSLRGESYPENAAAFYAPVIERLNAWLSACVNAAITVEVTLTYFNSSSTKMLFSVFDALDRAAAAGIATKKTKRSSNSARNCKPTSRRSASTIVRLRLEDRARGNDGYPKGIERSFL
jgi:hypothetical protein